ncbi:hypothetical protein [Solirubrum puertoriconensis]|uniref:UspA domain-containing protein n=1 Tax=Solirubrum puertoriconensis TaxID=1751427 RepID=A0A9X0HNE4_SOLP1|nr:hypothetical protein [Solirubrum puertoriconensis]KUG09078.1 hypothetical protein ASU33_19850 [Solirubrum puertoriconensis]
MLRLLVLVAADQPPAYLATYFRWLTAPAGGRAVVLPLPTDLEPLSNPLRASAALKEAFAGEPAGTAQVADWPAGLPFMTALQYLLEQHRASAIVLGSPFTGQTMAAKVELTPTLSILVRPPCPVLVMPLGKSFAGQPSRAVLAVSNGRALVHPWIGATARDLLRGWSPGIRLLQLSTLRCRAAVGEPACVWKTVLPEKSGLPPLEAQAAQPGKRVEGLLATAEHQQAGLLVLLLRARDQTHLPLTRRDTIHVALQAPVPTLLLPTLP